MLWTYFPTFVALFPTRSKWTLFPSGRFFLVDVISVGVFSNCGRFFRGPFFRTPSKAYYYHIRRLRYIRPYLESSIASTIATTIVHSKLDYCISNSLYCKLLSLNYPCHITAITPILHVNSLHWLRITKRIKYNLLSLTYKLLTTIPNLHTFITSSLFSVLEVLALHSSLLLFGYRHHRL